MDGHRIFYVTVDVTFTKPLDLIDETGHERSITKQGAILGFIQEIGCTATTQWEMQEMVRNAILSGQNEDGNNVIVHFDRIGEIAPKDVRREIYQDEDIAPALKQDPTSQGIWYQTGRAFYHD